MWKKSSYSGAMVPFSEVTAADDYFHPVTEGANFTSVETNLYGFNIPEHDIQCNIYMLWHPVFNCMSMHLFVFKGKRFLKHHLEADYFNEQLYLPAVDDLRDYRLQLGSCEVRVRVNQPLNDIHLECIDTKRQFALDLQYEAAMPPVGRPGGHHFTQLMKTSGSVTLDGKQYAINGRYMRDRSWGYSRPEEPECTPPYRWMTGWFGDQQGFVLAWIDTNVLDGEAFGANWHDIANGVDASGENKWESGGETPSLNFRSGWFAVDGKPIPVVSMDVRTLFDEKNPLLVRAIEIDIKDANGDVHCVSGESTSMIPKMYWQNLLTYMHAMKLTYQGQQGQGDLMDTYSSYHLKSLC